MLLNVSSFASSPLANRLNTLHDPVKLRMPAVHDLPAIWPNGIPDVRAGAPSSEISGAVVVVTSRHVHSVHLPCWFGEHLSPPRVGGF